MPKDPKEINGETASTKSTWTSSITKLWTDFMDDQRVERLKKCEVLQEALSNCRRGGNQRLEEVPNGFRMVKYFDWRDFKGDDTTCQRELHAVWACRGVALGCGQDVVQLRNCLRAAGPEEVLEKTTTNGYERWNDKTACGDLQRTLVECVTPRAQSLVKRRKRES